MAGPSVNVFSSRPAYTPTPRSNSWIGPAQNTRGTDEKLSASIKVGPDAEDGYSTSAKGTFQVDNWQRTSYDVFGGALNLAHKTTQSVMDNINLSGAVTPALGATEEFTLGNQLGDQLYAKFNGSTALDFKASTGVCANIFSTYKLCAGASVGTDMESTSAKLTDDQKTGKDKFELSTPLGDVNLNLSLEDLQGTPGGGIIPRGIAYATGVASSAANELDQFNQTLHGYEGQFARGAQNVYNDGVVGLDQLNQALHGYEGDFANGVGQAYNAASNAVAAAPGELDQFNQTHHGYESTFGNGVKDTWNSVSAAWDSYTAPDAPADVNDSAPSYDSGSADSYSSDSASSDTGDAGGDGW